MIEQILTVPVDDDITFTFKSIGEIREGDEYTGYRVALTADFPPMAVPLKLTSLLAIKSHHAKFNMTTS